MSLGQIGRLAKDKHHQWNKPYTKNLISKKLKSKSRGPSALRMPINIYDINSNLVKTGVIFYTWVRLKLKMNDLSQVK